MLIIRPTDPDVLRVFAAGAAAEAEAGGGGVAALTGVATGALKPRLPPTDIAMVDP
jgi:hypothetical protein